VAALVAAAARRDAELAAAHRSYVDGVRQAEADLAAAAAAADEAERRAAAAAAAVLEADAEADRIWAGVRRVLGWRGMRLGDTPAPADIDPQDIDPGAVDAGSPLPRDAAEALLARAARRVAALRRDGPRGALPWQVLPLLPVLGAVAATVVALLAGGLVTVGRGEDGFGGPVRLAGYLCFLAAPFAGVPLASAVADRRFGARLDTGGIGLIVLGGMVAGCAISFALR
jgi:hypothetical protein